MNPLDKNLLPEEEILFQTKKHIIIFLPSVIMTVICVLFLINSNPYIVKFSPLPALAAALSWLSNFLTYATSHFMVTNKRILLREGFFFKHTNETRFAAIANVTLNQSLLGQFLRYGTVIIYPFGGIADPFTQIAYPQELVKQLQVRLDQLDRRNN